MNEAKHTPGPWHVDAVHSEALHEVCMTNPPPKEGNPVVLASVEYDQDRGTCPTLREANANARLIAAAPDLLAACQAAMAFVSTWQHGFEDAFVGQMRAAIAKATGASA